MNEERTEKMRQTRKEIVLHTFDCIGCGRCIEACGNGVLKFVDNGACRFINVADAARCTGCGRCERRCPKKAISLKTNDTMKNKLKIAGFLLGGLALLALAVAATMWLWNALIPEIVGWKSIGYWQALGLIALMHLLLGHFGRPFMPDRGHRHLHEMMHGMSRNEKRDFIRRRMQSLCEREQPDDDAAAQ